MSAETNFSSGEILAAESDFETQLPAPEMPSAERQLSEIRDLLFGQQARSIESALAGLQAEMFSQLNNLSTLFSQNLQQTQLEFAQRLDALSQHVDELSRTLDQRMERDMQQVSERISQLQQSSEQADSVLEQQLQDMTSTLNQTISTRAAEFMDRLTRTQLELRDSKADRKTLAGLLDRMATELNQDA